MDDPEDANTQPGSEPMDDPEDTDTQAESSMDTSTDTSTNTQTEKPFVRDTGPLLHPMFRTYERWKKKLIWCQTFQSHGNFAVPNPAWRHIAWLGPVLKAVVHEFECNEDMMNEHGLKKTKWYLPHSIDLTTVSLSPLEDPDKYFDAEMHTHWYQRLLPVHMSDDFWMALWEEDFWWDIFETTKELSNCIQVLLHQREIREYRAQAEASGVILAGAQRSAPEDDSQADLDPRYRYG